jgi:hypothetical protein
VVNQDARVKRAFFGTQVVATLVDFYDNVLPCFPPQMNPVAIRAKAFSEVSATMLDALGQAAASFDNAGELSRCTCTYALCCVAATASNLLDCLAPKLFPGLESALIDLSKPMSCAT